MSSIPGNLKDIRSQISKRKEESENRKERIKNSTQFPKETKASWKNHKAGRNSWERWKSKSNKMEGIKMKKDVFERDGKFLGTAEDITVYSDRIEIIFPGDFPGMISRTVVLLGGRILYEDKKRIYVEYE